MSCIHDWDFTDDVMFHLVCLKCGYKLEDTDILNHMTMLESDLANERNLYAELDKSSDALAKDLSDLEIAKDQLFDEAFAYKKRAEKAEAMVERLINAGEYLAESYREKWTLDDEPASTWRWDALVAEYRATKAKESVE